ncbi:hypothetical protein ACFS07_12650 [Undibacterium arcticum]
MEKNRFFYQTPAHRKIDIAHRQLDHAMQMIRQHDPCVDDERMRDPHHAHRITQKINVTHQQIVAESLE